MKIFHCSRCDRLAFFENTSCVNCGSTLAFLPDVADVGALEMDGEGRWRALAPGRQRPAYRLCANYVREDVCNWANSADDPDPYCRSCRLTRLIPQLSRPGNRDAWARLETAKRRLIYSLLILGLPLAGKAEDPGRGLAFQFLADPDPGTPDAVPVLTGHDEGVITINLVEADSAERERRRYQMHEPYRTLLGHFRHEIGHYYWDRLVRGTGWIDAYRRLFGDERQDYDQAIRRHHQQGAPADWAASFVSVYASSHPWEDWAETWAHYLHMTDTLETALACGLSLRPMRADEPSLDLDTAGDGVESWAFDRMMERWFPLTYVLNNLNRGMGLLDAYPFVLPPPAVEKLRFVHEVVGAAP